MLVDTKQDIIYRDFTLNDKDTQANIVAGSGIGSGISGCIVDSIDISDVDVVQFVEKRSEGDGMDAGPPFHGARRIRLAGTLYGLTRALLADALNDLRATLNARLAYFDEPADKGYQPFYFAIPTNRVEDYPDGAIELRMLAMPRAFQEVIQKDKVGGNDGDPTGIEWQATLVCKDPAIMAQEPQEYAFPDSVEVTGATIAVNNIVTKNTHGLSIGDRLCFTALTGGTPLAINTVYYVIAGSFTANTFKVSLTSGGAEVDVTVLASAASFAKVITATGDIIHRGNYPAPLQMIFAVSEHAGTISVQAGDTIFSIVVPASAGARTIRYKGADRVITVEEDDAEVLAYSYLVQDADNTWPVIMPGTTPYTVTVSGTLLDEGATDGSMLWVWEQYA